MYPSSQAVSFPTWIAAVKWDGIKEFVSQSGYVKQISDPLVRVARSLDALVRGARVACQACCLWVRCFLCVCVCAMCVCV